jgi:hypothetical protein
MADARAAHAMSRVLSAEHEASARVAACERRCQEAIERARERRHALLARAQQRIVLLHGRAARALEERAAAILRGTQQKPVATPPQPELLQAALARLVDALLRGDP